MNKKYVTKFSSAAQKKLRTIKRQEAVKILEKMHQLQDALTDGNLRNLDIKKLEDAGNTWRLKIGDHYRVAYTLEESNDGSSIAWVWVIAVGSRENFYKSIKRN
ncbi:type II toxin-antitoxin system RelE family toxin [Rhodococcus qingshengii]|uniref:type II toxin-antitoxin system RelE family toxin n=1 Tax=Rhodococcus qingshengii TaxID=334542 RepID=UPI0035DFA85A